MDPISIIAWLSSELAAVRAENARLQAEVAKAAQASMGLALAPDPTIGHPRGSYPARRREAIDIRDLDDPLADDAELKRLQLTLSDTFLAQSRQVREIIRILVQAYPRFCRVETFAGRLTSMREGTDGVPTRNQLSTQIHRIRKTFGHDAVEIIRGDGWRAGERLRLIFDKKADPEGEADADLAG